VNLWAQTIGIVLVGGWARYTFVYKERVEPSAAPVNIVVDLGLKTVAESSKSGKSHHSYRSHHIGEESKPSQSLPFAEHIRGI
jgi:hypothetical protein